MRQTARGQTMLLFALTLMLVALMVCLTLSIATKTKEKMELQMLADAAAYSNAVVTARVFNEVALMNRAQTAQMVSMAGVQSLISWSGFHRAQIERTRRNYRTIRLVYDLLLPCCIPGSGCNQFCSCARDGRRKINQTRQCLQQEQTRIQGQWDQRDTSAGQQVLNLQSVASAYWVAGNVEYGRLMQKLNNQRLSRSVVDASRGGPWAAELSAPAGADGPNMTEMMPMVGSVWNLDVFKDHHVSAAMGSRGWTFTTNRGSGAMAINSRLAELLNSCGRNDQAFATNVGSGYWAETRNHGQYDASSKYSIADDHGMNVTVFNRGLAPCPTTLPMIGGVRGHVFSTDRADTTDQHVWSPQAGSDAEPPNQRHTMGSCVRCPGMWPFFVDYNAVRVVMPSDNFGQPRLFATVQRNYRARNGNPDPWNLLFRYRFNPGGAGVAFDPRGIVIRGPTGQGLDISRQTAVSTGIAYYHRGEDTFGSHWREPPNFLNPFWRATLVPHTVEGRDMDLDTGSDRDIRRALNGANVGWAADAHRELERAQFRGWQ